MGITVAAMFTCDGQCRPPRSAVGAWSPYNPFDLPEDWRCVGRTILCPDCKVSAAHAKRRISLDASMRVPEDDEPLFDVSAEGHEAWEAKRLAAKLAGDITTVGNTEVTTIGLGAPKIPGR